MHSYASAAGTVGVAFGEVADTAAASSEMLAQAFAGTVEVVIRILGEYDERGGTQVVVGMVCVVVDMVVVLSIVTTFVV